MTRHYHIGPDALVHLLPHFEVISSQYRRQLLDAGMNDEEIARQLATGGSKFLAEFATSPFEVLERVESDFGEALSAPGDADGRLRLSLTFPKPVGIDNLMPIAEVPEVLRPQLTMVERRGVAVHALRHNGALHNLTCRCNLIFDVASGAVITMFPGIMAPPLPAKSISDDPFWANHCFLL